MRARGIVSLGAALLVSMSFGFSLAAYVRQLDDAPTRAAQASSRAAMTEMIRVPAGPAWIGCVPHDAECDDEERPGGEIENVSEFSIDQHEVTVAAYRDCVMAGACTTRGLRRPVWFNAEEHPEFAWACNWGRGRDDHPMNCASWYQAGDYCRWRGGRLPSDIEWEKAARGRVLPAIYPWGDIPFNGADPQANIADASAGVRFAQWQIVPRYDDGAVGTAPVGSYPAGRNTRGLDDMVGNVEEWTSDWSDEAEGTRSIRGSSWHRGAKMGRISRLYSSDSRSQPEYGGFRCAMAPAMSTGIPR